MELTEILGDSIREDLNFVASKLKDLPKNKSITFIGKNLETIKTLKESKPFSKIEIDKNENRYKIKNKNYKIYFILSKNLEKFKTLDYTFLIDFEKIETAKARTKEKVFLLTDRKNNSKELNKIRDENYKNLEIIQLGLPESWTDF